MELIILGVIGFVFMLGSDLCALYNHNKGKYFLAFFGVLFIFVSSIVILFDGNTYAISNVWRFASGFFTLVFFSLLFYSVVIEVNKKRDEKEKLLTTGTYALSRHPGVLWFMLYYVFGSILFASTEILIAGLIWSFVNVIYVLLQEKLIFHKLFKNYGMYVKTTPMLLPTSNSFKKCITTLNGGQNERFTSDV